MRRRRRHDGNSGKADAHPFLIECRREVREQFRTDDTFDRSERGDVDDRSLHRDATESHIAFEPRRRYCHTGAVRAADRCLSRDDSRSRKREFLRGVWAAHDRCAALCVDHELHRFSSEVGLNSNQKAPHSGPNQRHDVATVWRSERVRLQPDLVARIIDSQYEFFKRRETEHSVDADQARSVADKGGDVAKRQRAELKRLDGAQRVGAARRWFELKRLGNFRVDDHAERTAGLYSE